MLPGVPLVVIDPNYTLIEIAVERDHFDVVMALTEAPTSKPTATPAKLPAKPPQVARSVSTFVPRSLADQVRDFMASSLEVVADGPVAGLALLNLPPEGRCTFFLPREVMELPIEQRRVAIGMLLEDACARSPSAALFVPPRLTQTVCTSLPRCAQTQTQWRASTQRLSGGRKRWGLLSAWQRTRRSTRCRPSED